MFTYDIKTLPFISMTGRSREKPGWSHSGRTLEINLLTVIHRGECIFKINETEYRLSAGQAVLVPKDTYYKPHTDSMCEYTFFHFDGDLRPCSEGEIIRAQSPEIPSRSSMYGYAKQVSAEMPLDYCMDITECTNEIELLLAKCSSIRANHQSKRQILLSLYFSEILFHMSDVLTKHLPGESTYPQTLSKILYYIKENYTTGIRLEDICAHTNISKQYCMRLFKKHMGITINDYILELRMKHAAYLLRSTYMNINQAADYLGFSSVSYFSRVFKRYFGVSPSEYSE